MSTQETQSESLSQSQSQSQSQAHTDFLVSIATEHASLKVQIKQEYDNSCAIICQVNKLICEIESCKRDLNKFSELRNVKVSELKILEADLESSHSSRERIQCNIDFFKNQVERISFEEEQKKIKRNSVAERYKKMIQNQMENNWSHPLMTKRNEMHNNLDQNEIQLAVLTRNIDDWHRKIHLMDDIQRKRLISAIIELACVFVKKRMESEKKTFLMDELNKKKMQLQKLIDAKGNSKAKKPVETVIFQKPALSRYISKNMNVPKFSSNITPSLNSLSESMAEQSDLKKHFQQVSAFKTAHNSSVLPLMKLSRPFSPRNFNFRQKFSINRMLKSPVDRQFCQSPSIRPVAEKMKHYEKSKEYMNIVLQKENVNTGNELNTETNLSMTETNLAKIDTDSLHSEIDSCAPNSEVAAINSKKDAASVTVDFSSGEIASSKRNTILNNRAHSVCRSNCSTPVSIKSVGSQKGRSSNFRTRFSDLKSPRPVDSMRTSVRFSPIAKIPQSPKTSLKRNTGLDGLLKSYRTPDILLKLAKKKQLSGKKTLNMSSSRPPKQANIDLIPSSLINAPKSKSKKLGFEAAAITPQVEQMSVTTELCKESHGELQNTNANPVTHVYSMPLKEIGLQNFNSKEEVNKIASNKQKNLLQSDAEEATVIEQNHSKYFLKTNQSHENTIGDVSNVNESYNENSPLNNEENVSVNSTEDPSKPNSAGSNDQGSHFSSATMSRSGENFSFSSPVNNFVLPFASSNEGGVFGFDNAGENHGFSLSKGVTNSNGFPFNLTDEDMGKPTFSLF